MASLQDSSLEEEQFTAAIQAQGLRHSAAATALPLSHGAARKWFYKDPQGEIQGAMGTGACRRGCWGTGTAPFSLRAPQASLSDHRPLPLVQALSRHKRWQSGSRPATSPWPCL